MMLLAILQSVGLTALTGGTVHSMVPGEKPVVATVLISDDRIQAVGPDVAIPEKATRVDVTGMHLIPGLIDGLVNHDPDHDRLYVTAGVTLVRDVGNDLAHILAERDKDRSSGARDRGPGPAIWSCGAVMDGAKPATTAAIVIATPEDAEQKLSRFFELEPDFVSVYSGLTQAAWKKILELSHAQHLQVWGPLISGSSLVEAAKNGQDGVYYLEGFLPQGKSWDKADFEELSSRVDRLAGQKIAITPTLDVFASRLHTVPESPPEFAYLGPLYITAWAREEAVRQEVIAKNPEYARTGLRVVQLQGKLLKLLYDRGIALVPGSASPNAWLFPGRALVDELQLWARAGIPPESVLAMATSGAAKLLGADKDRGTIQAGKIADLVVLKGDPTANLASLATPEKVVLRGRVLDRATMDALRKSLSDAQKRLQKETFDPTGVAPPKVPIGDVLLKGAVESTVAGVRVSSESYAVVRTYDKSLVYCSRTITPAGLSTAASELELSQTIHDGELVAFEAQIKSGPRLVLVQGTRVGGSMNIERRVDGAFAGTMPVRDRLALVDLGCSTTELIVSRLQPGAFKVICFEDFEPAVGNWALAVDKRDGAHYVKTDRGSPILVAKFKADGTLAGSQREQGTGIVSAATKSSESVGEGLPLPPEKAQFLNGAKAVPADATPPKKDGE